MLIFILIDLYSVHVYNVHSTRAIDDLKRATIYFSLAYAFVEDFSRYSNRNFFSKKYLNSGYNEERTIIVSPWRTN